MNKGTSVWLSGLLAALIGGSAEAVFAGLGVVVLAPEKFEVGPVLWKTLIVLTVLSVLSGIKSAAFYLKQSPVPAQSLEITATQTTTLTATPSDEKKG